ncbi:HDOD domain-containing protein [Methyloterricola oryzae]|uniref:HDOD domain-containing protein n=1 Tax=Methyloterricola oryzae TaxID=1495050 RepID=UPI0009E4C4A8|nr:HDOD domain-containing protein [Methyloterricola oryzae]
MRPRLKWQPISSFGTRLSSRGAIRGSDKAGRSDNYIDPFHPPALRGRVQLQRYSLGFSSFWRRLFGKKAPRPPTAQLQHEPTPVVIQSPQSDPDYVGMDRHALANSFNELLLESGPGSEGLILNDAEHYIVERIEKLLSGSIPDSMIPKLPEVAASLFRDLSDPDVHQDRILSHLRRDPAMVSEVLRLANSPIYRVTEEPLENLERAVVLLGLQNLKSLVSSVLMKPVMEIRPIYFRMFGQHLWQHSLDCAQACQNLDLVRRRADPFNSYLVGLMHDVGKLVIFRLLVDSFREVAPSIQPRGEFFSQVVRERSARLSLSMVEQWSLPPYLRLALEEQQESWLSQNLSVYGHCLQQANMLAEFKHIVESRAGGSESLTDLAARFRIPVDLYYQVFPQSCLGQGKDR